MQDRAHRSLFRTQLAVLMCLFSLGCSIKGTNGSCSSANTAQITVNDALIQRDCGCTEGAGAFSAGATNFVCTFPINTRLFIVYNTSINHYLTFGNYSDTGSQVSGQFIVTAQ
jgi:hypothetical protein